MRAQTCACTRTGALAEAKEALSQARAIQLPNPGVQVDHPAARHGSESACWATVAASRLHWCRLGNCHGRRSLVLRETDRAAAPAL